MGLTVGNPSCCGISGVGLESVTMKDLYSKDSRLWVTIAGFLLVLLVAFLDSISGSEYVFGIFYVVPVFLVTWRTGRMAGILCSILSAALWILVDFKQGYPYSSQFVPLANSILGFGLMVATTYVGDRLRKAQLTEATLARVDPLTGILNRRGLLELARRESLRTSRHRSPLTIAYIDLDNFKNVNDELGHAEGDGVLRTVARLVQESIRQTDVIARLGGDEFALLLPDTGIAGAKVLLPKLRSRLNNAMQKHGWAVTFSVGCITFVRPVSVEEMLERADSLMYAVKNRSKDAITWALTGEQNGDSAQLKAAPSGAPAKEVRQINSDQE